MIMNEKDIIKDQFNKQARKFSNWAVTQNLDYMQRYFEFCEMSPDDTLLDVACGSGEFATFCASRIAKVVGVDISDGMIDLGVKQARDCGLGNIEFACHDVDDLPFNDELFSCVISKSAFHHFADHHKVMKEMVRCCRKGGRISIQDIMAYEDKQVDKYFESLEKKIDISHNRTLSEADFIELFKRAGADVIRTATVEVELDFDEYVGHAVRTGESQKELESMLTEGLADPDISRYFVNKDGILYFRRNVFLALGRKP